MIYVLCPWDGWLTYDLEDPDYETENGRLVIKNGLDVVAIHAPTCWSLITTIDPHDLTQEH